VITSDTGPAAGPAQGHAARPAHPPGTGGTPGTSACPADPPDSAGSTDGTPDLVASLFRAHGVGLIRLAVMLVGDQASAEDVVQDAFLGLHRALPGLRDREKALAYLRASVVNRCRSVQRSRRRAWLRRVQHDLPVWSAESAAMATEERRAVLAAVARLPRRSREVLAFRYYLDLPQDEIAAILGISRGTVSSTISRALAELGRDLKEEL
jgi:RNA polymerase sigma-70 factor (sigma-E family)